MRSTEQIYFPSRHHTNVSNGFIIQSGPGSAPREQAASLGQGMPPMIGGQPVQYAWKEMIRVGQYTHPKQGWTLSVTPERLKTWEANFHKMRQNGTKPFLPAKHVAEFSGAENYGYLIDMKVEPRTLPDGSKVESLVGLHQLIGEDAHRAAARNESSVYIQERVKDAQGNTYAEAITHNAIIPDPVVTGLGGFVAMSASASDAVPIYSLAIGSNEMTDEMKALRTLCGLADTVTDEKQILAAAATRINGDGTKLALSLSAQTAAETKRQEIETKLVATSAALVLASNKADQAEARALSLSGGAAMPDDLATEWHGVYSSYVDALAAAGNITPDCRDAIKTTVLKNGEKVNGMALSKSAGGKPLIALVIDALKKNVAIPMGKLAKAQALSQSSVAGQGAAGNGAEVETLDKPSADTVARLTRLGLKP